MLTGSSALILELAVNESPWIFENPKLRELFQNCLFHFFIENSKQLGTFSGALNLSKNLSQGFCEFAKDCEATLKVLLYPKKFRSPVHPRRLEILKQNPDAIEFFNEFPFFLEKTDNFRQSAV